MKKYITEFIGTFFLVTTISLTGDPIAIGAALMVMIYAGGHISGAHYNPAVTLAVWIRGRITSKEAIPYMIVQVIGAIAAAGLYMWLAGKKEMPADVARNADSFKAVVVELIGTFALGYVVLNVATSKATSGNSYFGLAIGFTVLAMALAFGKISGGAFNPAVAIGLCLMKMVAWADIWIYLVGCFGGGLLAAIVFNFLNPDDK
ncbi:MAG TPA: aquaporin [Chitinophagaceae bacterium]|nr:aquaporin [Chitinophagaceae bacterium]